MTIAYINGFETGDASEINALGAGASIVTSPVRTGNYALKTAAGGNVLCAPGDFSTTQAVIRVYLQIPALPSAATIFITFANGAAANILRLRFNASNQLEVFDAGASLGLTTTAGTFVPSINTWYRITIAADTAAGGAVKVWQGLPGSPDILDINTTHTTQGTGNNWGKFDIRGAITPNEYFFDDVRYDINTLSPPGDGQIITRQGKTGTPTYDAWTKNGQATSTLCWSETPFGTTNNCSSSTSTAAQTMVVEKFSITQSGHGTQVVGAGDTINAVKTVAVLKQAVSGTPIVRHRVNGVDTDFTITQVVGATDFRGDDWGVSGSASWTTTAANLDLLEAGVVKGADANATQVEDVWVMVDYTPVTSLPAGTRYDLDIPRPARRSAILADIQAQYTRIVGFESGFTKFVPDLTIPPPFAKRLNTLKDIQDQFVRIVGQEKGFTKFIPDLSTPGPARRSRALADLQDQFVRIVGRETLPGFNAEWVVPAPLRRLRTLGDPQDQFVRVTGQETLPGFNATWVIPSPLRRAPTLTDIQAQFVRIVGQGVLPNFNAEWVIPAPLKRISTLTSDPQAQFVRVVGQERLPGFNAEWTVPTPLRRISTLTSDPQAQFVRIVGQEKLPGFNSEWVIPAPLRRISTLTTDAQVQVASGNNFTLTAAVGPFSFLGGDTVFGITMPVDGAVFGLVGQPAILGTPSVIGVIGGSKHRGRSKVPTADAGWPKPGTEAGGPLIQRTKRYAMDVEAPLAPEPIVLPTVIPAEKAVIDYREPMAPLESLPDLEPVLAKADKLNTAVKRLKEQARIKKQNDDDDEIISLLMLNL